MQTKTYVQYGAGSEAVPGWLSFDSSPTLRIQRLPLIGKLLRRHLNCVFDEGVKYGDISKGLPLPDASVDVVFCSHVLEHLALDDFYIALRNTFKILKPKGVFRTIVPDFQLDIQDYLKAYDSPAGGEASIVFFKNSCVGKKTRAKTIKEFLVEYLGNSSHLWMWDEKSLSTALSDTGFVDIKRFFQGEGDPLDGNVILPERPHQFVRGIALQCRKP